MYMYMLWDMDYVCGVCIWCMDVAYTVWCMYVVYGCGIHSVVYVCGVWMWCMGVCCDVV